MELKIYLRILLKKWWIVLPIFLITLTATVAFTFTRTPTYESTATFVVKPNPAAFGDRKSLAYGVDLVSRRTEIATTYTQVATSRAIKKESAQALGVSSEQKQSISVDARLLAGTNVIRITVQGSDPVLVRDFASTVGERTLTYVKELYEAFDLIPLDQPVLSSSPVKPNKKLNLALGTVGGLVLGVGLAFVSEYLETPLRRGRGFEIIDEQTGAYNKRYFLQRLGEEMSRAKHNGYPLSLAMINVDQLDVMGTSPLSARVRNVVMGKVAAFLKRFVREEDVIGRVGKTTFAILLPDLTEKAATAMMDNLQAGMMWAWAPLEIEQHGIKLDLNSAAGVVAYGHNGLRREEFVAQAELALKHAETAGYGRVSSFHEALLEDGNGKHTGLETQ